MKQAPNIYPLKRLLDTIDDGCQSGLPDGRWVPARPLGFYSLPHRLKAAWMVFTGRADAVVWPGDER